MDAREVRVVRRPKGAIRREDFALAATVLREPGAGEALVENLIMSVDPYIRLHLDSPQAVGARLIGGGIGRVLASDALPAGTLVRHRQGFADRFVAPAASLVPMTPDPEIPLEAYLSVLGGIGLCAYGGLLATGRMQASEQVFVSAAAGAVGCLAVQVAKLKGARVVASVGSAAKAAWVRELGADAAIDYKVEPIGPALARETPDGLDVYFDNVGGAHFQAALHRMNHGGRVAVCGMISTYNGDPGAVSGLEQIVIRRLTVTGFGFTDFPHMDAPFAQEMTAWLKTGRIQRRETVLEGLNRAPEALVGLFEGLNAGKMLLRVA